MQQAPTESLSQGIWDASASRYFIGVSHPFGEIREAPESILTSRGMRGKQLREPWCYCTTT